MDKSLSEMVEEAYTRTAGQHTMTLEQAIETAETKDQENGTEALIAHCGKAEEDDMSSVDSDEAIIYALCNWLNIWDAEGNTGIWGSL